MSKELRIENLEELKKASIPIDKPIRTFFPIEGADPNIQDHVFDPTYDLEEAHHCFRELFGVIAFIDEEEVLYVIPACEIVRKILEGSNFIPDSYLRIPFIFMDVPLVNLEKWNELLDWGFEQRKREYFAS